MKGLLKFALLCSVFLGTAWAQNFKVGDNVFVGIPSTNIRDDAFIIGEVTRVTESGDYQISVTDYVEGHDYGAFCTPVAVVEGNSDYGKGWELWEDTSRLQQANLEFVVAAKNVFPLRTGQYNYIERNNTWVVFGRWLSDAPILAPERIKRAQAGLESIGLAGMYDAFDLVIAHRLAFYENGWGRPYWPYETLEALHGLLDEVDAIFTAEPALEALWRSNPRDQEQVKQDVRTFFLLSAIDKLVNDVYNQQYEDLEKADSSQVLRLEQRLTALGKKKRN